MRVLANAVIPNEYGIDPSGKLRIGSRICAALLGKVLADLGNMREESLATAHVQARCQAGTQAGMKAGMLPSSTPDHTRAAVLSRMKAGMKGWHAFIINTRSHSCCSLQLPPTRARATRLASSSARFNSQSCCSYLSSSLPTPMNVS